MYMMRPVGQSPFSAQLVAERAGLSGRIFARRFKAETSMKPAA
tara:strand:+ start:362 stop:490 length:129 start_codon:yes stop_codon:yes gene_type:complete